MINNSVGGPKWWVYPDRIIQKSPNQLILDAESALESFFMVVGLGTLVLGVLGAWSAMESNATARMNVWYFFFLVSVTSFVLYKLLDDIYIVDLERRVLYFKRTFIGVTYTRRVSSLDELWGLAVDGRCVSGKSYYRRWKYGLTLVTNRGKQVKVLPEKNVTFQQIKTEGKKLANTLGLKFAAGFPETYLRVKARSGEVTVDHSNLDIRSLITLAIIFLAFGAVWFIGIILPKMLY